MKDLPKQITKKMFISCRTAPYYSGEERIGVTEYDPERFGTDEITLGTVDITIDVPQGVNVLDRQVMVLRKQKAEIIAKATAEAEEIDHRIQELLALPAGVAA